MSRSESLSWPLRFIIRRWRGTKKKITPAGTHLRGFIWRGDRYACRRRGAPSAATNGCRASWKSSKIVGYLTWNVVCCRDREVGLHKRGSGPLINSITDTPNRMPEKFVMKTSLVLAFPTYFSLTVEYQEDSYRIGLGIVRDAIFWSSRESPSCRHSPCFWFYSS